jgi:hypothetical protein
MGADTPLQKSKPDPEWTAVENGVLVLLLVCVSIAYFFMSRNVPLFVSVNKVVFFTHVYVLRKTSKEYQSVKGIVVSLVIFVIAFATKFPITLQK